MESITPVRLNISDRFPVASFIIRVPSDRYFEIVCTTNPSLFHIKNQALRTSRNFFTTRREGLLRAPMGEVNYLIPVNQLRQFAGNQHMYYALATYGSTTGAGAHFSISPDRLQDVPFIRFSPDFTGSRHMTAASQIGIKDSTPYGGKKPKFTWGGDQALLAEKAAGNTQPQRKGTYDDGFDSSLWRDSSHQSMGSNSSAGNNYTESLYGTEDITEEPPGYEDAFDLRQHGIEGVQVVSSAILNEVNDSEDGYDYNQAYGTGLQSFSNSHTELEQEPDGYEDARQLQQQSGQSKFFSNTYTESRQEPYGYEDACQLYEQGGEARRIWPPESNEGQQTTIQSQTSSYYGNSYQSYMTTGRSLNEYSEEERFQTLSQQSEQTHTETQPVNQSGLSVLTIRDKFHKIIVPIAHFESGLEAVYYTNPQQHAQQLSQAYSKVSPNRDGTGLSWGILRFTQSGGMIGRVLEACKRRDEKLFNSIFGEHALELLDVTNGPDQSSRMKKIAGYNLWDQYWLDKFIAAGNQRDFWPAQHEVALEHYIDSNLLLMNWIGFNTDRAMAMFCDRCVQMGNGGGRNWIFDVIMPVKDEQQRLEALKALRYQDVISFQQSIPELAASGEWTIDTQAAVFNALRQIGPQSSFIIHPLNKLLDSLVTAAQAQKRQWMDRIQELRINQTDFQDTVYQLV